MGGHVLWRWLHLAGLDSHRWTKVALVWALSTSEVNKIRLIPDYVNAHPENRRGCVSVGVYGYGLMPLWQEIHKQCAECFPLPLLIRQCRAKASSLPLFSIWTETGIPDLVRLIPNYVNAYPENRRGCVSVGVYGYAFMPLWQEIHERCAECFPLPLLIRQCRAKASSLPLFSIWTETGIPDLVRLIPNYVNAYPENRRGCVSVGVYGYAFMPLWQEIHERCAECFPLPLLIRQCRKKTSSLPLFSIWTETGIPDLVRLIPNYVNAYPENCRGCVSVGVYGYAFMPLWQEIHKRCAECFPLPLLIRQCRKKTSSLPLFSIRSA
jgi:hypothetical protein